MQNYHTKKWFSEKVLVIETNKTEVKMNKPVYLVLSVLDVTKIAMYVMLYKIKV